MMDSRDGVAMHLVTILTFVLLGLWAGMLVAYHSMGLM